MQIKSNIVDRKKANFTGEIDKKDQKRPLLNY